MHLYLALLVHRDYFARLDASLSGSFVPQGLLYPGQMHLYLALLCRRDYFARPDASHHWKAIAKNISARPFRQIPIHHVRVRSIRLCSFPLKWRSGLTKFPIGTPRPQTNVSASLHLSHSTIISVPAPISTIHIISINVKLMLLSFQS